MSSISTHASPPVVTAVPDDAVEKWALQIFLAVLTLVCISHIVYFSLSEKFTSSDEAHYMSGALSIANGIRTGTLSGAWAGYRNALGFKAPLICVPAGLFMLFTDSLTLPFSLTQILTFAALGLASYSLFRNCFGHFQAAMASLILLCMPLVTGLTHTYYVELLLLLLTVAMLDVLLRFRWHTVRGSILIGVILGLGLLCKLTFPLFIAVPVLFSFWTEIQDLKRRSRNEPVGLATKVSIAGITALIVAGPWYAKNFAAVLEHSRVAAYSNCCYYSGWVLADLSAGPSIPITLVAIVGLLVMPMRFVKRVENLRSYRAWIVLLLLGISTAIALVDTSNKSTRLQVTWLPTFAALSVAAWYPLRDRRWFWIGPAVTALLAIGLSFQNSFEILSIGPIRFGDLQILNSRYALNPPDWFNDNHPVDRRDYRLKETEARIAADAAVRFGRGNPTEARTTTAGLLVNHYYFDFVSSARKHRVHYLPWWVNPVTTGAGAPNYIVHTSGFDAFYPGIMNFDYYPRIEEDVTARRIPYEELFHLDGPANSKIVVFVRRQFKSRAAEPSRESILIEAEAFKRGDVAVDNGQNGYGKGIGVINTPKPGGFAEYDFEIPVSGAYQVELRYASGLSRPIKLTIDGNRITDNAAAGVTGGFMPANQMWEPISIVTLHQGHHTLRLETTKLFPHVDRVALTRVQDGMDPKPASRQN